LQKRFKLINFFKRSPEYLGLLFVFGGYFFVIFSAQIIFKIIQIAIIPHYQQYLVSIKPIILAGLSQDISATSYILGIVVLFGFFQLLIPQKSIKTIGLFFIGVTLSLLLLTFITDIFLLNYWSQRISGQAIYYLKFPQEIGASLSSSMVMVIAILLMVGAILIKYCLKITVKFWELLQLSNFNKRVGMVFLPLLFIGMRGGVQNLPVDIGSSMKFEETDKNTLAVNGLWNGIYTSIHSGEIENVELFKSKQFLNSTLNQSFILSDTNISTPILPLNTSVVLVVMEGVSAELSSYLKGKEGSYMPFLDSLASIGISCNNMFATGDRTDKGIVSLLSGWPGQPWESILHSPEKLKKLPNLSNEFYNNGYKSTFLYGGDSRFANILTYLKSGKFQNIMDRNSLKDQINDEQGKWGYHDATMLNQLFLKLKASQQPEFFTLLTLSTHEPYDCLKTNTNSAAENMKMSVKYLDSEIRKFWYKFRSLPQFKNTVVIFTSDHGKDLGNLNTHIGQRNFFHIPLIIAGGGLPVKMKGFQIDGAISQTDIYNSVNDLIFGKINPLAKYSRSFFRKSHTGNALFNLFQVAGVIEKNNIYWLGTDKMSMQSKSIKNQQDSLVLSIYSEIISDFYKINETF